MSEKSTRRNKRRPQNPARRRARGGAGAVPVERNVLMDRAKQPIYLLIGAAVIFGAIWASQSFAEVMPEPTVETEETTEIGFKSRLSKAWGYLTDGDPSDIVAETDDAVAARLAQTEILEAQLESERDALIDERDQLEADRAALDDEYMAMNQRKAALTQCVAAALGEAD